MKKYIIGTIVTLFLIGCGGGGTSPIDDENVETPNYNYVPYNAPAIDEDTKNEYLTEINNARAEGRYCGDTWFDAVPPLKWSTELYNAAYEHNVDMAKADFFAHDGSGTESDWTAQKLELGRGSHYYERIKNNSFNYTFAGENASTGYTEIEDEIIGYINSEGHCKTLMDKDFKYVGIAHLSGENSDGVYHAYGTHDFGAK